jgi:hypothetical protein
MSTQDGDVWTSVQVCHSNVRQILIEKPDVLSQEQWGEFARYVFLCKKFFAAYDGFMDAAPPESDFKTRLMLLTGKLGRIQHKVTHLMEGVKRGMQLPKSMPKPWMTRSSKMLTNSRL